jgi:hypothetical protein
VATKPASVTPLRCIVPVDAFYEWKKIGAGKQPYAIVDADGRPRAWPSYGNAGKIGRPGDTVQTSTVHNDSA